jgi:biofilm PGA synthesis N-glycosyltransferase PgaC
VASRQLPGARWLPRFALGTLGAVAATGHVLYPLFIGVSTRRKGVAVPGVPETWPAITVVVPAYREEAVIEAKVADLLANGYDGPIRVVVVADDERTAAAARRAPAFVMTSGDRLGKAEALNHGMNEAATEIVVFTDANTRLVPGSLAALVRWFADPSVGAVAGEKTVAGTTGEGAYWRFESWLKQREARTGFTVGLVGELGAVRRTTYRPLPPDLAVDDLWMAIDVFEGGGRIAYEPSARAEEDPSDGWRDDWERRTRVGSGILDVLWRRRDRLAPSQGLVALQLWGHRAVRSSFGPLAHLIVVLIAIRNAGRSRLALLTVATHLAAAVAMVRTQRRTATSSVERLVGQTLFLQVVGLAGLVRYLKGDRPALWPKPDRPVTVAGGRP